MMTGVKMKIGKFTAAIIFSALTLSMTACGTTADKFVQAEEEFYDSNGVVSNFTHKIEVSYEGKVTSSTFSGTLFLNNDGEDSTSSLVGTLSADSEDGEYKTEIRSYYEDGVYYSDAFGEKNAIAMSFSDALLEFGLTAFPRDLEEDSFKAISREMEGDLEKISFLIAPGEASLVMGVGNQFTRFARQNGSEDVVSLKEITGYVLLDGDEPVKLHMNISGTIIRGDESVTVTNTIDNSYELTYRDADVESPAQGEFNVVK